MNPQINELNYDLNRIHLMDQMREAAEYHRQMQLQQELQQQAGRDDAAIGHNTALNSLGRQMIKIGEWLQNQ